MKEKLGFGHLGNGITVWDFNREENNDYLTVAHISEQGNVTYYKCKLSSEAKSRIEDRAQRVKDELKINELLENSTLDETKQKWQMELKSDASFGYYFDYHSDVWVSFDNRDGNCNVEEFRSVEETRNWLSI